MAESSLFDAKNDSINNYLESIQFRRCNLDPCVYVLYAKDGYMLLGLYMYDILMAGSTPDVMKRVTQLCSTAMKSSLVQQKRF